MPTGRRKLRGEVHRDGDWHAALHIWVGGVDEEDGSRFVLFQRRSATKDTWPGALDVAVGGHLRAGETLGDAVRECEEEIGLAASLAELVRLGRRFARDTASAENEVQEVFALRSDRPLETYRLHPDEVDALVRVPLAAALALFQDQVATAQAMELSRGDPAPRPATIAVGGFAGERDGYPLRALQGLSDVLAGTPPAAFELR